MLSRRRFLLLCGLLMSAPCTVGTAKTRNVLVPSAPGQVIVVGPGGGLVAGGVPLQIGGPWVDGTYAQYVFVTYQGSLYVSNAQVVPGDAAPGAYAFDGIEPVTYLSSGVTYTYTFDGYEGTAQSDDGTDFAPFFIGETSLGSCVSFGINLTNGGDLIVDGSAFSGSLMLKGNSTTILLGVDNPFTFSGLSAGVYTLVYIVSLGADDIAGQTMDVTVTASAGAVISSTPAVQKWTLLKRRDWPHHLSFAGGVMRGKLNGIDYHTGASGAVVLDLSKCVDEPRALIECTGAVTSLAFQDYAGNSGLWTGETTIKIVFKQSGGGSLAANLWTSFSTPIPIENAADIPTALGSSVDDTLIVYLHWSDLDQAHPTLTAIATYPSAASSLPSWWTPATLTVSTDAVGTYPSNTLTIDWTVSREYSVSLDAPLGNLVFLPSTGAMSPTRPPLTLRFNQQGGSGALHPDVWILTGGSIMNWRDLPTSIGTSNGDPLVAVFDYDDTAQLYTMIGVDVMDDALENTSRIDYENPINGFSYTMYNGTRNLVLDPAGALATGTVTLPSQPHAGEEVKIVSTKVITAFTLSPNAGQSVTGAPSTLAANVPIRFVWDRSNAMWWPE